MSLSDILGTIGLVVAVLSIAIGYMLYRMGLQKKEPYWTIISNNLIERYTATMPDLQVLYKGQKIENLTVSKLWVWNKGRATLDKRDLQTINPLRLVAGEHTKILNIEIVQMSNTSNQMTGKLAGDGTHALINFDYLDHGQGGFFQVIHTGTSSADLAIVGDIKGAQLRKVDKENDRIRASCIATPLGLLIGAGLFGAAIYLVPRLPLPGGDTTKGILFLASFFIPALVAYAFIETIMRWALQGPRGLHFYIEEDPTWQAARRRRPRP